MSSVTRKSKAGVISGSCTSRTHPTVKQKLKKLTNLCTREKIQSLSSKSKISSDNPGLKREDNCCGEKLINESLAHAF